MLVLSCGEKRVPSTVQVAAKPPTCPDPTKLDEIEAFNFEDEYRLSPAAAGKLKAAALVAVEVTKLESKLDADFGIACAQIAHDLGTPGDWRSGSEACAAAITALQSVRTKLGPKARTQLVVRSPICLAEASLVTKCASLCDSSVTAEKSRSECELRAGHCDGNCEGSCEPKSSLKCDGVCGGNCEGSIKGTCGGRCNGTCDGKRVNGGCLGTCVGTCDKGSMTGECKGSCTGSCTFSSPGICDGTCAGKCSVEFADTKCAGNFKAPLVSTECRARCDLAIINETECSPPQVSLAFVGVKDRLAAETMRVAIEKAFPALVKILSEVGPEGSKHVLDAQAVIESARSSFKDFGRSGGAGAASKSEGSLASCFDEPFKKAIQSAVVVRTGIRQAGSVRDQVVVTEPPAPEGAPGPAKNEKGPEGAQSTQSTIKR